MAELENHYQVLQVDPSAEPEIIVAAYRRLALKYHPDTNKSPEAVRKMQDINGAYSILSDPVARARYDQERANQRQVEPAKAYSNPTEEQQRVWARAGQNPEIDRRRQAEVEAARWREQEKQRRDKAEIERNWAAYESWKRDELRESTRSGISQLGCALIAMFIGGTISVILVMMLISWETVRA